MRKIISVFAVIALLVAFSLPARATDLADEKYVIVNTDVSPVRTLIPITLIIPEKSRIISVTCTPITTGLGAHYENVVAIFDAASTTFAATFMTVCEGEVERDDADTGIIEWKRPLKIYNGCVISQGAKTVVCVEFEDIPQP